VDAAQTGLFNALPVAVAIPADLLARWFCWRFPYGPASRSLLPWLLLALDGSSVRGRGDEPSLAWIAALSVFVLLEKIIPRGFWVAKVAGLFLMGLGGWMALSGGA